MSIYFKRDFLALVLKVSNCIKVPDIRFLPSSSQQKKKERKKVK